MIIENPAMLIAQHTTYRIRIENDCRTALLQCMDMGKGREKALMFIQGDKMRRFEHSYCSGTRSESGIADASITRSRGEKGCAPAAIFPKDIPRRKVAH